MKRLMAALALIGALGGAAATLGALDGRYAKSWEVAEVKEKQEAHELEVRIKYLQEHLWDVERYWAKRFKEEMGRAYENEAELLEFVPKSVKEDWDESETELEEAKERLKELQKGKKSDE